MKILAIHNFHRKGSASGDDQVFKSETALLESHGNTVIRYTVSNDEFDNVGVTGKLLATFGMLWSFKHYNAIRKIIKREQPDIVHIHTFFHCYHRPSFMPLKEVALPLWLRCMIQDLFAHVLLPCAVRNFVMSVVMDIICGCVNMVALKVATCKV